MIKLMGYHRIHDNQSFNSVRYSRVFCLAYQSLKLLVTILIAIFSTTRPPLVWVQSNLFTKSILKILLDNCHVNMAFHEIFNQLRLSLQHL